MLKRQDFGTGRPSQETLDQVKNNQNKPNKQNNSSYGYSGGYSFSYPKFYDLDLSIYDKLLGTLRDNYNNSKNNLNAQLQGAIDSINKSRKKGAQDFSSGRALIAENSYDRQRQQMNDLASRGLAGSGLQQLGDVQEAMEKGNQVSSLANNYYTYLDNLQEKENEANRNHSSTLAELENAYNNSVANVEFQRWNAKNQYEKDLLNYMTNRASAYNSYASRNNANADTAQTLADEFGNYVNSIMAGYDLTDPVDASLAYDAFLSMQQNNPEAYSAYYNAGNNDFTNWAKNYRMGYRDYSQLDEDKQKGYTVDPYGNFVAPVVPTVNYRKPSYNSWNNLPRSVSNRMSKSLQDSLLR